ncbi:HAD-superfamily subfamily IB hydrolase, TIGR01490 [Spongiibacter sp. IMCC21906]|uniref:HAD-IB family hydrolase n=1 Tax=Spongiibacter sp. IMCC21906 TaxID=1620392 RepID=UPI00062DD193|nr:HAD-IB family hydrolase [Spongiibacter sp. IMCC21906]AKH69070.1 HAD-superfamily subfamily IB hydrolase, TIGR01490 [Spongiibacter sp. IMCC21906]
MSNIDDLLQSIAKTPKGPKTLAVFDFDGTIISGYSPLFTLKEQFSRGDIDKKTLWNIILQLAAHRSGLIDDHSLMELGAGLLKGEPEAHFESLCDDIYRKHLFRRIYPEMRKLIAAHQQRGHHVVIASSSPRQILTASAKELGVDTILSSTYIAEEGVFNGEVAMPVCWGYGKRLAVERLAEQTGASLKKAFFYSDSDDDLPLLESVGNPVPVNPNHGLQNAAAEAGWATFTFSSRRSGWSEVLRSLGLYSSLFSSYVAAKTVARLAKDETEGRRFMVASFTNTICAITGIKIELKGAQYLHDYKPRVVIFNHQSQADGLIVMKLLGEHFAAIGKDAFGKRNPLSNAYSYVGIIPIDRSDGKSAIESMKPLIDAIKKEGRSVAIAPEGTRSTSVLPGPFKKGAFHLALDAGVEILPVVFHNSADVQAKGDLLFHPATVRVEILPPVSTANWQRADLDTHIQDVRQRFIDTINKGQSNLLETTAL